MFCLVNGGDWKHILVTVLSPGNCERFTRQLTSHNCQSKNNCYSPSERFSSIATMLLPSDIISLNIVSWRSILLAGVRTNDNQICSCTCHVWSWSELCSQVSWMKHGLESFTVTGISFQLNVRYWDLCHPSPTQIDHLTHKKQYSLCVCCRLGSAAFFAVMACFLAYYNCRKDTDQATTTGANFSSPADRGEGQVMLEGKNTVNPNLSASVDDKDLWNNGRASTLWAKTFYVCITWCVARQLAVCWTISTKV